MNIIAGVRASGLWPMLRKEFIQLRRDRLTLAMVVVLPAVQLVLFGYAIRTEVRNLPTVVLDESRSSESRAFIDVMRNTGNFRVTGAVASRAELRRVIERGDASAAVIIPPDFAVNIKRGRGATAQIIVDAADPMASSAAISGASLAGAARSAAILAERTGGQPPLEVRVRPWYNPGMRSEAYIVPGVIGVLLSITALIVMSLAVVRERERGTLEQLVVTPLSKTGLLLGKVLPFVAVGYVQMTVVLLLGKLVFDIPVRGSLLLLYAITGAFITANLGIGLLISTAVKSQVQATQLGYFVMLPNILLSGFMFPREAMPELAQWIGLALPLTYFLTILRGILLKSVSLSAIWPETLALVTMAIVLFSLSVLRFRKTVD
ncbi:MAG: ABC transporter permease [Gemmatimonadaceae bacterium]